MSKLYVAYTTVSNEAEALKISNSVVLEKLVACANIINNMTSVYMWKGKKEVSPEVVVIMKTIDDKLPELEEHIKKMHSYENPCFIAWPIEYASSEYQEWVLGSVNIPNM